MKSKTQKENKKNPISSTLQNFTLSRDPLINSDWAETFLIVTMNKKYWRKCVAELIQVLLEFFDST